MTGFDYIALAVTAVFTLSGLCRGGVRQVFVLLSVLAGVIIAARHNALLAESIPFGPEEMRPAAAWFAVVFASLVVGWVLAWIAGKFVKAADLGCADRLLGGLLGASKGMLLVGVIVFILVLTLPPDHRIFAGSRTLPYILQGLSAGDRLMEHGLRQQFREKVKAFPGIRPPTHL